MDELNKIVNFLNKHDVELMPCSYSEIEKIERAYELQLPTVYMNFLVYMGKGAGEFMLGSSCFYNEIFKLRSYAIDLLNENSFEKELPKEAFVFWVHQGYQFAFFLSTQGENPPVYYYTEVDSNNNSNDFMLVTKSFTSFLNLQLQASFPSLPTE